MGIKTVINLRSFHSDRDELGDAGLRYVHVWAKACITNIERAGVFKSQISHDLIECKPDDAASRSFRQQIVAP